MTHGAATQGQEPDSSGPSGAAPLPLNLDLMFGKGFLWAEEVELTDWIGLESLRMEIPDLSFPFEAGGGVERFRDTRCQVREIEISIDEAGLAARLEQATRGLEEFHRPRIAFLDDALHVALRLQAFGEPIDLSFRAALLPPEPPRADEIHLSLYDYRWFGPLPYPARLLAFEWLTGVLDTPFFSAPGRGRPFQVGVAGDIASFRPFKLLLAEIFPAAGWKLPNLADVVLDDVRIRDGELRIRATSRGSRWGDVDEPVHELRDSREGRRALAAYESKDLFARADEALFAGRLDDALERLAGYRDQYGLHPQLASRILDCLLADPSTGHLAEAQSICDTLLEEDPQDLRAHVALASMAMLEQGREAAVDAIDDLAGVLRARGDVPDWVLAELAAAELLDDDQPSRAADRLDNVLSVAPHDRMVLERLRSLYERLGDTEKLEGVLERLTAVYDDREALRDTYVDLARHLMHREGELAEARQYLQKALDLYESDPEVLETLGESYELSDKPMRAVRAFSSAARTAEDRREHARARELQFRVARLWRHDLDEPEQALLTVRRALSATDVDFGEVSSIQRPMAIEHARQLAFAAELCTELGRDDEAIGHWSEAISLLERIVDAADLPAPEETALESPASDSPLGRLAAAHRGLAEIYEDRERRGAARRHWERLLELDPTSEQAVDHLVESYKQEGRAEDLFELLESRLAVVGSATRELELHRRLADLYDQIGDDENAALHREEAESLGDRVERPSATGLESISEGVPEGNGGDDATRLDDISAPEPSTAPEPPSEPPAPPTPEEAPDDEGPGDAPDDLTFDRGEDFDPGASQIGQSSPTAEPDGGEVGRELDADEAGTESSPTEPNDASEPPFDHRDPWDSQAEPDEDSTSFDDGSGPRDRPDSDSASVPPFGDDHDPWESGFGGADSGTQPAGSPPDQAEASSGGFDDSDAWNIPIDESAEEELPGDSTASQEGAERPDEESGASERRDSQETRRVDSLSSADELPGVGAEDDSAESPSSDDRTADSAEWRESEKTEPSGELDVAGMSESADEASEPGEFDKTSDERPEASADRERADRDEREDESADLLGGAETGGADGDAAVEDESIREDSVQTDSVSEESVQDESVPDESEELSGSLPAPDAFQPVDSSETEPLGDSRGSREGSDSGVEEDEDRIEQFRREYESLVEHRTPENVDPDAPAEPSPTVEASTAPPPNQRVERARREDDDQHLAEVLEEIVESYRRAPDSIRLDEETFLEYSCELGKLLYYDLEEDERALPHLERVFEEAPEDSGRDEDVLRALDSIYEARAAHERRTDVLEARLEGADDPELARTYRVLLARLEWRELDDGDLARERIDTVLEEAPDHEGARRLGAEMARALDRPEEAADHLEAILEADDAGLDALELRRELAELYLESLDDPDRAARLYEEVLDDVPGDDQAVEGLQESHAARGDWEAYLQALGREIGLMTGGTDPVSPEDFPDLEIEDFALSSEMTASQILAEAGGIADDRLGRDELARGIFGAAARIWPENVEALERRIELDRRVVNHWDLASDLVTYASSLLDSLERFSVLFEAARIWRGLGEIDRARNAIEGAMGAAAESDEAPEDLDEARQLAESLRDADEE